MAKTSMSIQRRLDAIDVYSTSIASKRRRIDIEILAISRTGVWRELTVYRSLSGLKQDSSQLSYNKVPVGRQSMVQMEQVGAQGEKLYEDTVAELARVRADLEAGREKAERQAARLRENMETIRRSFHSQICELEQELAHSRASATAAHKEKEEVGGGRWAMGEVTHLLLTY